MRRPIVLFVALIISGCATYRLSGVPGTVAARVTADPVISAGLPVRVVLRQVDGRPVDLRYSSADLPPGRHEFLVDCRVAESGSDSRHVVTAELEPGGRYRFVGVATSRRCETVELRPR